MRAKYVSVINFMLQVSIFLNQFNLFIELLNPERHISVLENFKPEMLFYIYIYI